MSDKTNNNQKTTKTGNKNNQNSGSKKADPNQQLSTEQLQKLLAAAGQEKGSAALQGGSKKKGSILSRAGKAISGVANGFIGGVDGIIKFVLKKEDPNRSDVMQKARSPVLFGVFIIFLTLGVGGIWSATAPLNKAAVAVGKLVPSTHKQTIQHKEGGIIKDVYVSQGDYVEKDGPIIALNPKESESSYEQALYNYRDHLATKDRLLAERDTLPEIEFSQFLLEDIEDKEVQEILETQRKLFNNNMEAFNAAVNTKRQRISQLEQQIEHQKSNLSSEQETLKNLQSSYKSRKQLVQEGYESKEKLKELQNNINQIKQRVTDIKSKISEFESNISQLKEEIIHTQQEHLSKVSQQLRETQNNLSKAKAQYIQTKEQFSRQIIRSPVEGTVNKLNYDTIGGVVRPGEPIAEVTPKDDKLIIEAKVDPNNIDAIKPGLVAKIKFSAFKSRTSPNFKGEVVKISPDTVQEQSADGRTSEAYIATIEIDMENFREIAEKRNLKLYPGMHAEVMIVTGTRTLLQYLLSPVLDNMDRAFREK
jgi:HlyD family secretion protein